MSIDIRYGTVTAQVDVEIDLNEILEEVDSDDMIQLLRDRGEYKTTEDMDTEDLFAEIAARQEMALSVEWVDPDIMLDHLVNAGRIKPSIFSTEDLEADLLRRGVRVMSYDVKSAVERALQALLSS